MSKTIFRALVVASIVLAIAAAAIDTLLPNLTPQPLSQAYEDIPLPEMFTHPIGLFIFICWALAGLAGNVALLFFKRWGRSLSLYTTIIGFFLYPFFGPTVMSGLANALYEASLVIWGSILAISYTSSIAEFFATGGNHERQQYNNKASIKR